MEHLYGKSLPQPRLASKQTCRANHAVASSKQYYKVAYYIPYLDHLIGDLKRRFINSTQLAKG